MVRPCIRPLNAIVAIDFEHFGDEPAPRPAFYVILGIEGTDECHAVQRADPLFEVGDDGCTQEPLLRYSTECSQLSSGCCVSLTITPGNAPRSAVRC